MAKLLDPVSSKCHSCFEKLFAAYVGDCIVHRGAFNVFSMMVKSETKLRKCMCTSTSSALLILLEACVSCTRENTDDASGQTGAVDVSER